MKQIFLSLLFVSFAYTTYAKEIEVEAMGVGKDYEWAVMNALDNVVKQTTDVTISRTAPMLKMEVNAKESLDVSVNELANSNDGSLIGGEKSASYSGSGKAKYGIQASAELKEINAKYEGKISSYSVISSEQKDGNYYVKIKAIVKKVDDYNSPDLIKKAKYSLSIVPFKADKQISCVGKRVSSNSLTGKISSILSEKLLKSKKFNIVDRENLDAYAEELSLVNNDFTNEKEKSRLKNIASADYILVGKIEGFSTNKTTQNVPMTGESYSNSSASIQISYKLLETATMEVITSSTIEESLKKGGSFSSCNNVEKKLAQKVGLKISTEILTELFPDHQPAPEPKKEVKRAVVTKKAVKQNPIKLPFD